MSKLIRWDPNKEINFLHESLDKIFDDLFTQSRNDFEYLNELAVNMVQTEDALIIKANMPGIKQEDLNISVAGEVLSISAESNEDESFSDANYHLREIKTGKLSRSFSSLQDHCKSDSQSLSIEYRA